MKIAVPAHLTYSVEEVETFLVKNTGTKFDESNKCWVVLSDEALFHKLVYEVLENRLKTKGSFDKDTHFADAFFNWKECFQKHDNIGLFAEITLLQIYMKNGKPGPKGGAFLSELNMNENESIYVLIHLPKLDFASKNSKWFRALALNGNCIEFSNDNAAGLSKFIENHLAFYVGKEKNKIINLILDKCEGNFTSAHNEIVSLKLLYNSNEGEIDLTSLVSAIDNNSKHNPFILPDIIKTYDKKKILQFLRELKKDNVPLPLLIWIVANDSRKTLNIKSEKILISLHEIDKHLKGITPGDPWVEFERAIINY
ncbi:DNA polymerase III subunit delta [Betaproteobacteria bacterium]|nr:DNA polymerase III subunit delta [Betaproteobacteria bacterium]